MVLKILCGVYFVPILAANEVMTRWIVFKVIGYYFEVGGGVIPCLGLLIFGYVIYN